MKVLVGILVSPIAVLIVAALAVLFGPPMQPGAAPIFLATAYGLTLAGVLVFALPFSLVAKRLEWHSAWHYGFAGLLVGLAYPGIVFLAIGRPEFRSFGHYLASTVLSAPLATIVALVFWYLVGRRSAV